MSSKNNVVGLNGRPLSRRECEKEILKRHLDEWRSLGIEPGVLAALYGAIATNLVRETVSG